MRLRNALFVFFLLLFWPAGEIFAQEAGGISLEPAFQETILAPGQEKAGVEVSLENQSSQEQVFRLKAVDFGSLDESGGVAFLGASGDQREYALADWLAFPQSEVVLAPGERKSFEAIIENNDNLSPGGHYGALVFESILRSEGGDENQVAVNQVFSSLIFLKKEGGEIYGASIEGISLSKSLLHLPGELDFSLSNTGNTHIVPRGKASVKDPLGREVSRAILNEESTIVLPDSKRTYKMKFSTRALAWLPGNYVLQLDYRYDGKEDFSREEEQFFFVPSVFLAGVSLFLIIIWYFSRKRSKKKKSKLLSKEESSE